MANRSDEDRARELNAIYQRNLERAPIMQQPELLNGDPERVVAVLKDELREIEQVLEIIGTQKNNDDGRYCWVCFATDEEDTLAAWVQPCKCIGTTKWVHQSCLQRWVDEKQKGNAFKRVNCPQCRAEYIIVFPEMGTFVSILEGIDSIIKRLSPFLAAGVIVGSLYWTAVTYGAVTVWISPLFQLLNHFGFPWEFWNPIGIVHLISTHWTLQVLQVFGHKNGLDMLERADPLVLLIGLPAIPAGLILGRMICWEEMILKFIQSRQNVARKFPFLNLVLPHT